MNSIKEVNFFPTKKKKKNQYYDWWGKVGLQLYFSEGVSLKLHRLLDFSDFGDFFLNNILLRENLGTLQYKVETLLITVEPGLLTLHKKALSSAFQCLVNLVCD